MPCQDNNIKWLRFYGDGVQGSPAPEAFWTEDCHGNTYFGQYDTESVAHGDAATPLGPDQWRRIEVLVYAGTDDQTDDYAYLWVDGVLDAATTGVGVLSAALAGTGYTRVEVGHYIGTGQTVDVWTDDYYLDVTPQRVEICTGSTWAARGTCEIQLPSGLWTDDAIEFRVNAGAWSDAALHAAYLYVVDQGNNANPEGYALDG